MLLCKVAHTFEFQASQGYIKRPILKKQTKKPQISKIQKLRFSFQQPIINNGRNEWILLIPIEVSV